MPVSHTSDLSGKHESTAVLLARAQGHRAVATYVNPVLANAYLRRAAELRLEAWVLAARSAPLGIDEVLSAVAA
jgi:hypothetical protein